MCSVYSLLFKPPFSRMRPMKRWKGRRSQRSRMYFVGSPLRRRYSVGSESYTASEESEDMLEFCPFYLAFGSPIYSSYIDWGSNQLGLCGSSTEPPMDINLFVSTCGSKFGRLNDRSQSGIALNRFVSNYGSKLN
jgi:hypothetical protein